MLLLLFSGAITLIKLAAILFGFVWIVTRLFCKGRCQLDWRNTFLQVSTALTTFSTGVLVWWNISYNNQYPPGSAYRPAVQGAILFVLLHIISLLIAVFAVSVSFKQTWRKQTKPITLARVLSGLNIMYWAILITWLCVSYNASV